MRKLAARAFPICLAASSLTLSACPTGTTDDAGALDDAGDEDDGGQVRPDDDGGAPDAGAPDGGGSDDAGTEDAGPDDAGPDDGSTTDGGSSDGGSSDGDGGSAGSDGGSDDGGSSTPEPPPYDLDSLTAPSELEDGAGAPLIHTVSHDADVEDWFVALPFSNNQVNYLYVGLVCEGTGSDNIRARVWSDFDDAPGFTVSCSQEEQRNTVNGQAVAGDVDYYVQVYVNDTAVETDVRYNLYTTPQSPLPAAVTGTDAPIVEIPPPSDDVAAQDFDSITRPSETGPENNLVPHDLSLPEGDREDWFPARVSTNNQQTFVEGELTCIGVEGTPSPSPLRATLYRNDEPLGVHLFCNQSIQQSNLNGETVQLNDVLHWRVTPQENAVTPPVRLEYTLY